MFISVRMACRRLRTAGTLLVAAQSGQDWGALRAPLIVVVVAAPAARRSRGDSGDGGEASAS